MPSGSSNPTPDRAKVIKIGVAVVFLLAGAYLIINNLASDTAGGKSLPPEPAAAQDQPAPAPAPNPQVDAIRRGGAATLGK